MYAQALAYALGCRQLGRGNKKAPSKKRWLHSSGAGKQGCKGAGTGGSWTNHFASDFSDFRVRKLFPPCVSSILAHLLTLPAKRAINNCGSPPFDPLPPHPSWPTARITYLVHGRLRIRPVWKSFALLGKRIGLVWAGPTRTMHPLRSSFSYLGGFCVDDVLVTKEQHVSTFCAHYLYTQGCRRSAQ